jgi:hypothetical protein
MLTQNHMSFSELTPDTRDAEWGKLPTIGAAHLT